VNYETLLVGLLLAVLYVEIFEIYPGGIIVPGYMALQVDQPQRILVTVAIAFLCLVSYRFLTRYLILFGKRRFAFMILLGALWAQLWMLVAPVVVATRTELLVVGWLIPGLLANTLEKQRVLPTLASLFTVAIATSFIIRLVLWLQ
jgi:poly-gamma-glutamate biosynthesis protein PgsC/CapC